MTHAARIKSLIPDLDPRLVEARMHRLAEIDELDAVEFSATARKAAHWVDEVGTERAEAFARSYGLEAAS